MKITTLSMVLLMAALLGSCSHEKNQKDSQVNARIDSLVMARTEDIAQKAYEDLDRRMAVELKPKVDSILRAWAARDSANQR